MNKGNLKLEDVPPHHRYTIVSTGEFVCLGLADGKPQCIYGPVDASQRFLQFVTLADCDGIEVRAKSDVQFTIEAEEVGDGTDPVDPNPVEATVQVQRPLSIQEEIRRFVREEVSARAVEEGQGSFEEEDDFDVPDEWEDPTTPYTHAQIQDDYIEPDPELQDVISSPAEPEPKAGPTSVSEVQPAKNEAPDGEEPPQAATA